MAQEKPITLTYTVDEIIQEAQDLENDEEMSLFLKVQRGATKYNKYLQLINIIEKLNKKK